MFMSDNNAKARLILHENIIPRAHYILSVFSEMSGKIDKDEWRSIWAGLEKVMDEIIASAAEASALIED